jgi:hypothetical protein
VASIAQGALDQIGVFDMSCEKEELLTRLTCRILYLSRGPILWMNTMLYAYDFRPKSKTSSLITFWAQDPPWNFWLMASIVDCRVGFAVVIGT